MTKKLLCFKSSIVLFALCFLFNSYPAESGKPLKTKRDRANRTLFLSQISCPSTLKNYGNCPGYIVDHINPLACGGDDHPSNMQWQTVLDAKAKDKWERKSCEIK